MLVRGAVALSVITIVAANALSGPPPSGATRYVSTSGSGTTCSQASPCATFAAGYNAAAAGDTVEVAAGTYAAQNLASLASKATPTRIVIRPATGAAVHTGELSVSSTSHVEVRDMQVDTWDITNGSTDVILRNLSVLNQQAGGYFGGAHDVQILGGEIGFIDPNDALHFNNANSNTNTNVTIDGLYVHDLTRTLAPATHTDCMQTGDVNGLVVRNSRFVNCATQSLYLTPYDGGFGLGAANNITIENNMVGPAPEGSYSLYIGPNASNVTVRNNSFTQAVNVDNAATGVSVVGNIFGVLPNFNCLVSADNSVLWDYNVSNAACGSAKATHHTTNASVMSQFVSTSTSPASAFDLHLNAGAAAIDKGSPSSFPTTDFDGQARFLGVAPDAGADEKG